MESNSKPVYLVFEQNCDSNHGEAEFLAAFDSAQKAADFITEQYIYQEYNGEEDVDCDLSCDEPYFTVEDANWLYTKKVEVQ